MSHPLRQALQRDACAPIASMRASSGEWRRNGSVPSCGAGTGSKTARWPKRSSHRQARRTCTGFCSPRPLASGPVVPWRRRAVPLQRALNRHLEPRPVRRAPPHQLRPYRASPATSQTAPPSRLLPSPAPSATASTPSGAGLDDASDRYGLASSPSGARSQPASHSLRWRYRLGPADRKKPNHRALCRLREALGQPHSHEQDGVVAHLPAYREFTAEPSRRKHGSRRLRPQAPSHRKIARQRLAAGRLLRFPPRAGRDWAGLNPQVPSLANLQQFASQKSALRVLRDRAARKGRP